MALTTRRTLIVYWLLLILPALFMAGAVFRLLSHEKERIHVRTAASLEERAAAMAESLELTVTDVEDALTQSLMGIDPNNLVSVLVSWESDNPLVRNVFVWKKNRLLYPVEGTSSTPEERRFIGRYEALFTGRMAWDFGGAATREERNGPENVPSVASSPAPESSTVSSDLRRLKSGRKDLLALAKQERTAPSVNAFDSASTPEAAPLKTQSGWIPWFAENQLFILGWVQPDPRGPVYGIELETMALLSRLVTQLPVLKDRDTAYGLLSGEGLLLHQSGAFPIDRTKKPVASVALSGVLPHYRIAFWMTDGGFRSSQTLIYAAAILCAMLALSMILGGALLIRDSRRSLKDAMEKTSFVSSVSHELKTPLTSIRMYAELLRDGRVKAPEKVSHYLSVIESESRRLTRLVNNVLDFGKLEEGKKVYHRSSFDLGALLRETLEAHSVRFREAGMAVELAIPDGEIPVTTDRDAVEQVVLNLMDNAVKYAASGGVLVLGIEKREDGTLDLTLRDRGPGIPAEHQSRIFEKFHRVDNSLTAAQAGSGLGLSIARRILRDLGGDLTYESEPEGGSCFRARIGQ
jgi:signal transduction histidine kinase